MRYRFLSHRLSVAAATVALAIAPQVVGAQPLRFDVNTRAAGAQTQSGWTAVNLNNINNVTFTGVGGITLADRDRGAFNNAVPSSSFDAMWRDFVFADERGVTPGFEAGLDITITGLLANTLYEVGLWAFDVVSSPDRDMIWNGIASYAFSGSDPLPDGLWEKRVNFSITTDASGTGVLRGRTDVSEPRECCNVFVNGFELREVPEPSSLALLGVGAAIIGLRARRRRLA